MVERFWVDSYPTEEPFGPSHDAAALMDGHDTIAYFKDKADAISVVELLQVGQGLLGGR